MLIRNVGVPSSFKYTLKGNGTKSTIPIKTYRQTDRQMTDTRTDGQKDVCHRNRHTSRRIDRQTDGRANGQTEMFAGR